MKKLFLLLLILPLAFTSCSSDDDDDKFDYDLNTLYGKWRVTHVYTGSQYVDITDIIEPTYATFNSDGTFSGEGLYGSGSGTYKANGKRITCYIMGMEYAYYDVISLAGTVCELKMTIEDEVMTVKCQKQ